MARPDPQKLAQALRTNLRRRKSATTPPAPAEPRESPQPPPQKPPQAPQSGQG